MPKAAAKSENEIQQPHIPCPQIIIDKVRQFNEQEDTYKSGDFSEAQLRIDYINPMLEALGWDVNNKKGHAEAYREVVYEDALKIGKAFKAPDYGFYIGGRAAGGGRKFFLEAKKPSVPIHVDPKPAFQLRRYAYSAQLPVSILTNFKEFIVYDTRVKPNAKDNARAAVALQLKYTEYPQCWHEIASVFSREAILKGAFDKFAQGKRKKGIEPLGESFLKDIERWREILAKDIAANNDLTVDELNFAVQRTIDRILFLRICEDRGIEMVGNLLGVTNGEKVYERLAEIFRGADDRYNSGIFYFSGKKLDPERAEPPDDLTLDLKIEDKTITKIIRDLYDTPGLFASYAFAMIPPEILGQVYERFLGKVITLKSKHTVKIEEKPEVRKAGGVYYTPTYIVDYIVKNTVGKLLEGKTPKEAAKITILDPASGSGSFLIGAYQYLLDWHLRWYVDNKPEEHCKGKNPPLMRTYMPSFAEESDATPKKNAARDYRLTTQKRKEILLNSIYGVDIDAQAVEVTKLSLLLKVLEGESNESIAAQLKFLHQRALPDLGRNIKCGNSLISDDFDDSELSEEERKRINKFNWQREFPQIFKRGGFDAVIGNPPYLNVDDTWGRGDKRLQYLKRAYAHVYNDKTDLLFYFLARAVDLTKGAAAFIVSRAFLEAYKADRLRGWLSANSRVHEIVDFQNYYVFKGVGITTTIVTFTRKTNGAAIVRRLVADAPSLALDDPAQFERIEVAQTRFSSDSWLFANERLTELHSRIDAAGIPLGSLVHVGKGMETGCNAVFGGHRHEEMSLWNVPEELYYIRARNSDIQRYHLADSGESLLYLEDVEEFGDLPKRVQQHLMANEKKLKKRAAYKRGNCEWWKYTWPLHREHYKRPRILCPYLATCNRFALDDSSTYLGLTDTTVIFDSEQPEKSEYLLGVLNSRLLTFRFRFIGKLKSGGIMEYFWNSISKLPIRTIDFNNKSDKAAHDRMVKLVDRMLELNKKLAAAKTPHDKERLPREIESTDRQIDQLVYELYGLTEEEIKIVEEATAK